MNVTDCQSIETLVRKLLVQRDSRLENILCSACRKMAHGERLHIFSMLANKNVRLAADVAVRVGLNVQFQKKFFEEIISCNRSNEIRFFVVKLFSKRLGVNRALAILYAMKPANPEAVRLAAYYFYGALNDLHVRKRNKFKELQL